jgi:ketosteroid isomerase-like protein
MTHKRDPVERSALRHREESTTPDVVEITRRVFAAAARRDLDALTSFFAPKAVWDRSDLGMGVLEGDAAISADLEDWWRNYEEWEIALDEVVDFGQGVVLSISKQVGSLPGASERLRRNNADIWRFADRMVVRWTAYADVDDARAAAERLAEERGWQCPRSPRRPT